MNNEQNNIIGGINPIPPTQNTNSPIEPNNQGNIVPTGNIPSMDNNVISGASLSQIGIVSDSTVNTTPDPLTPTQTTAPSNPVGNIPITPVPGTAPTEPVQNNIASSQTNDNILSVNTNSIVPGMNPNTSVPQGTNQNLNSTIPELKIESASPFDIGIASPAAPSIETPTSQTVPSTPIATENSNPMTSTTTESVPNAVPQSNTPPLTNDITSAPTSNDDVVSVGKYLGHMILFAIPIVGFIMLIVKAVDKKDKNISNYAKAQLLFAVIIAIISVIATIFLSSFITSLLYGMFGM